MKPDTSLLMDEYVKYAESIKKILQNALDTNFTTQCLENGLTYKLNIRQKNKIYTLSSKTGFDVTELRDAYGMISKYANSDNIHYLIFDVDNINTKQLRIIQEDLEDKNITYCYCKTPNGYHFYTKYFQGKYMIAHQMDNIPYVDKNYIQIGIERGYWFLEIKTETEKELIYEFYHKPKFDATICIARCDRIIKKEMEVKIHDT